MTSADREPSDVFGLRSSPPAITVPDYKLAVVAGVKGA
jgi:hypothetical protein